MDKYDLTTGSVWKKLVSFFLPIAVGTWFQQLYNTVDGIIVGKFVGTQALAAVGGSASTIVNVLINILVSLTSGAAVIISHYYGAKEPEKVKQGTGAGMTFCVLLGAVLTFVLIWITPDILRWMQTPAETMSDSVTYMKIYFSATIFILILNMESSVLRACGDSKRPLYYMVISCLVNIVLDYVFVKYFRWDVMGVAIATVISQIVNMILLTVRMIKTTEPYRLDMKEMKLAPQHLKSMLHIGVPSALQSCMYGISNTMVQVAINTLGTVIVASWSVSGKLDGFYWATCNAVNAAITTFVGQNYGAKRYDRIQESIKTSFKMFVTFTIAFSCLILLFSRNIFGLFSNDPEVIQTSSTLVWYFVPFYFSWTTIEILTAVLKGVGDAVNPVIILAVGICAFRIVWIFTLFKMYPTLFCISMCYPASWILTSVILIIYCAVRRKKGKLYSAS